MISGSRSRSAALSAAVTAPPQYGTRLPQPEELKPATAELIERAREHPAGRFALRMFATKLMRQKIENFDKLGLKVAESHRTAAEKNGAYFPLDRYTTYQSRSQSSLNSRRKGQVVNDVKKANTLFYNKVPYGNFDIVLHAEITEPPVQYTYNLTMQFQLPEAFPKKDVKEIIKYMWITDKGEVKELKVGS